MIFEKLSLLRYRIEQLYQDLKHFDEMPFRNFRGDFDEQQSVRVRAPRKNPVKVKDLKPPEKE